VGSLTSHNPIGLQRPVTRVALLYFFILLFLVLYEYWWTPGFISFEVMTASVVYWSEFLATDPEVRVRFPALPDFLRSSESVTGSTQPREYNWGATWRKSSRSGLENRKYYRRDPSPHGTLCPQKLALTSPTSGCRSVGIVSSRTQATEFFLICEMQIIKLNPFLNYLLHSVILVLPRSYPMAPIACFPRVNGQPN
jgi:hypothetical protein